MKNQYDNPTAGCYIDESSGSAEDCNLRTIEFAEGYGFSTGEPLPKENNEDRPEILSELADNAVAFLNECETRSFMYWTHEDNSLFLTVDVDSAREEVGFVSSLAQEYPDTEYHGEWLHVSDHGNPTLYFRDFRGDDGTDTEIWSVV